MIDLQTLASIGEFLSGLAIVVSLIYLIVNIRQNTSQLRENLRVLKRTEMRAAYEQHDRYRIAILDPDVANLVVRGVAGESLNPADMLRFNQFCIMLTYSTQNNWDAVNNGVMDADEWTRIRSTFAIGFVKTPGGAQFWQGHKSNFKPGFVQQVEEDLAGSNA